jgi:histidine triad (HIT) family protein
MSNEKTLFQKVMDREIPGDFVHEDDQCIVIRDIHPRAPVHLLVIPRKPIPSLNELEPEDASLMGHLFLVARDVINRLGHSDYRTVFNCGAKAGQEVFHLHLHVLAGRSLSWPPG